MNKLIEVLHLIDIGNTRATYGLASKGRILHLESMPCDQIPEIVKKYSGSVSKSHNKVIIASVVPKNTEKVLSGLYSFGITNVLEIGQEIKVPLKNRYKNSQKLGIDRQIDAFGAILKKKIPAIVIDFGTAITCDLINGKGIFLGGLIIPGPETSLKSLLAGTALLPKMFKLKKESGLAYGRNTDECIQRGVVEAYAAMTDGLISKLSKEFKRKPHVIITGGFSTFIGKIIKSKAEINPAHTLESMLALYTVSSK